MARAAALSTLLLLASAPTPFAVEEEDCAADELSALQHSQTGRPAHMHPDVAAMFQEAGTAKQAGGSSMAAYLGGDQTKGSITIATNKLGIFTYTDGIAFSNSLIGDICGSFTGTGTPDFGYHVHDKWSSEKPYATGADCGSEFTGGHWDPTGACGPATGNAACAECNFGTYNCSVSNFRWWEPNQYNAGNQYVNGNPFACELGDFSNMFGFLQSKKPGKRPWTALENAVGLAQLTAAEGIVSVDNPSPCKPTKPGFLRAGRALSELKGRSVVWHCGSGYENGGARIACAKLA